MLTFHWVASQYNLPNHTNQQLLQVWKHSWSASSAITQLAGIIFKSHSTEYSTSFQTRQCYIQERNLHTVTFCAPPLHNYPFVWSFTSPIMHACGHLITCLMQILLQNSLQLLRGYLASLLTILRVLKEPSQGVSKITTKAVSRSQHHSSFVRYWSSFCSYYTHLT